MKKLVENIHEVFKQFVASLLTLIKVFLLSKRMGTRYPIKESDEIIIMGNGPSLKKTVENQLDFFQNKSLISVNYFPNSQYYSILKPAILILQAPEFWITGVSERHIALREKLFQAIIEKTNWKLNLFVPSSARKYEKVTALPKENSNIQLFYFNDTPIEGFSFLTHFFFKNKWGMPRPHNVLIPSIIIALQLKISEIYLIGADHSWLPELSVNENNVVLINQKHFYDENKTKPRVMKKLGRGQRSLHEILIKFYHSFKGYFVIREFAESIDAKIYNSTPGSFIDAFERKEIEIEKK